MTKLWFIGCFNTWLKPRVIIFSKCNQRKILRYHKFLDNAAVLLFCKYVCFFYYSNIPEKLATRDQFPVSVNIFLTSNVEGIVLLLLIQLLCGARLTHLKVFSI